MKFIKDFITGKNTSFDSLSKTVQEIFQIFLHSPKSTATKEGLTKVLSYFDADRIYIGYFNDKESSISFIHESTAEGVDDATSLLNRKFKHNNQYEEKNYPFWIGNIKNGIDTIISDVDKLPMISETEIPLMKENNVQSSITTSIHEDGKVCGFLGIEYVNRKHKWNVSDIEAVHFFASIFSVVIENEYMHKEIISSSLEAFKNETIFQIIFETLPVGIELYDENGILRKINPYDLELLGTREEDILGVNLFENPSIPKEYLDRIKRGEPATFENDYHFDDVNDTYYSSENKGKVMRLLGKCTPLKDKDNNIFGYLELVHHDTDYYKKKEELRAKELELLKIKEFNNIRSIFISNISHEIRTPLNAILGFSKVIADSNKTEETQYFNDVIQQNNEILLHMVDTILSFSRIEAGPIPYKKEAADLKEICHSALNLKSFSHRP
jgi:PAS domain S-box-containing protein